MRRFQPLLPIAALFGLFGQALAAEPVDTLAAVKAKGVLVAGVRSVLRPFSYLDEPSKEYAGYEVDFVTAIAKALGVRAEFKPITSSNRIERLKAGQIDLIAATMSRTPERAKEIDFSWTYFFTTQKVLARRGVVKNVQDLSGKKVAAIAGSTSELNLRKAAPDANVVVFERYSQALAALQADRVDAVTTDEILLAGLLSKVPKKERYEIARPQLSLERYAFGVRKGDTSFLESVNRAIVALEKSGEAKAIFEKWCGSKTEYQLRRTFRIAPDM